MKNSWAYVATIIATTLSACQTAPKEYKRQQLTPFNAPAAPIEEQNLWGKPYEVYARATSFPFGSKAKDAGSRAGKSSGLMPLVYAAETNTFGVAAVAHKFRRGGIAVIDTVYGRRAYFMVDWGEGVEERWAIKKMLEQGIQLTNEEKNAAVFDFCEPKDQWVRPFIVVTVYPYIGKKDFNTLKISERFALLAAAKQKAAFMSRFIATR